MFKLTWVDSPPAFENKFKYLAAKLNDTGSSTYSKTASSAPVSFWVNTALPDPISPVIENLICSLFVYILIVSDKLPNYLQIRLNSFEGIVTTEVNSVSGMPKFYESRFNKDKLNSEILSPPDVKYSVTFWFELKFEWGWFFLCLESHTIIVSGDFEDFGYVFNGEAESKGFVADVIGEGLFSELERNQCDMAWVHGLNGESLWGDINVDHFDEVLEGVDYSAEDGTFLESGFKHMAANENYKICK